MGFFQCHLRDGLRRSPRIPRLVVLSESAGAECSRILSEKTGETKQQLIAHLIRVIIYIYIQYIYNIVVHSG